MRLTGSKASLLATVPLCTFLLAPLAVAAQEIASPPAIDYAEACKTAGVHLFAKPAQPATSIALDFSPRVRRELKLYYRLNPDGSLKGTGHGSWQANRRNQAQFWEERNTMAGRDARPPYLRFHPTGPGTPIDALTADILIMADVSDPAELDKPVQAEGLVRYALTATDRRDGQVLGTMVYVIDMQNHRACGTNARNVIDVEGFMVQAAAMPIVVPPQILAHQEKMRGYPYNVFGWLGLLDE